MISPQENTAPRAVDRYQWVVAAIGYAAILFGLAVITGWHAHLPPLVRFNASWAPLHYNTAICFVAAGVALASHHWRQSRLLRLISSGILLLIGSITLAEYLLHTKSGIDHLFFNDDWPEFGLNHTRMSAVSAFCLFLIGVALILDRRRQNLARSLAIGSLASIISSISVIALLGYVFELPHTYQWGQLNRISPHAACGLTVLGLSLFLMAWRNGLRDGERTPRWLPIPVAVGVFTGALLFYLALQSRQDAEIAETVQTSLETAKSQIAVRVDARVRSLVRIARRWEISGRPTQMAWEQDAAEYVRDFPDLQAIEWIDAARHTEWIAPLEGNEAKLHLDLTNETRRRSAVELARNQKQPAITRIVSLFRGGFGFIVYAPIYVGGQFDGWIAGVMKPQQLFDRYFPPGVLPGEAIRISEGGLVFYQRDTEGTSTRQKWSAESQIEVHGVTWTVAVWPTSKLLKHLDSPLPIVAFMGGIVGSLLLSVTVFLAQRSSTHNRQTARALRELRVAAAEIKTLAGLLPICATCKRVRDDTGYWSQIESYLGRHSDASFSHGYCPQCAANACHEFGIAVPARIQAELEAKNFEA